MPAIANLVINDGLTTPVAHTFSVARCSGGKGDWADRSPSIAAGYRKISHEYSEPSGNRTTHKIVAGFMSPTVANVNGVDTVVRYSSAEVRLNFAPDSTLQERKDLLAYVANFLGLATVKTSVENLEPFY